MLSSKEIKEKIVLDGITQEEFAHKVGVSQQVVSLWFKRDSIPAKYWSTINDVLNIRKRVNVHETEEEVLSIKALSVEAGASLSMDVDHIDSIEPSHNIALAKSGIRHERPSDLLAIPVSGISMLPTIMPDEYVVIDKSINRYVGDDLYVLNFAGNLLVKRVQYDPSTGSFDIISDNPQFDNYKLNLAEDQSNFHIIGKVITTIRR
jgi:phage repressor protein C with HTH and peptisase S24 domain